MPESIDPKNKEIWQNVSRGTVVVQKFDRRGEIQHELVPGGNKTSLTRDERLFNMEHAANETLDNFRNGSLVPVRLVDAEDAAVISQNPNLLAEDDLRKMVKTKRGFADKVSEISNYTTLARLKQIAVEEDATIKQVQAIDQRMQAVQGEGPTERQQTALPRTSGAVTP